MKILEYSDLVDKLNLSSISQRFIEIISNSSYAKNLLLRIEGFIQPEISQLALLPSIVNHRPFLNVEMGVVELADEGACLQLFSKIGQYTTYLNIIVNCSYQSKSLLSCFSRIDTLKLGDLDGLLYFNEIPPTLTTIKMRETREYVNQEVLQKLEQLQHVTMLTADIICVRCERDDVSNCKPLFYFSKELAEYLCERYIFRISSSKSLLRTTIEPPDIRFLSVNCSGKRDDVFNSLLKRFVNLEKVVCKLYCDQKLVCSHLHGVKWPKLRSLTLNLCDTYKCSSLPTCGTCFSTIMNDFTELTDLALPRAMTSSVSVSKKYPNVFCFFNLNYHTIARNQLEEIAEKLPYVTNFSIELSKDAHELPYLTEFHQLKKLKFTIEGEWIFKSTLQRFPLLPNLEELMLIGLELPPLYSSRGEYDTVNDWKKSPIFSLAQKCPKLKKFTSATSEIYENDVFATMNAWPEIQSLFFSTKRGPEEYSLVYLKPQNFIDFLQERKAQGWKPPLLERLEYHRWGPIPYNYMPKEIGFKFFDIFPSLKCFIGYGNFITLAHYQKSRYITS